MEHWKRGNQRIGKNLVISYFYQSYRIQPMVSHGIVILKD